MDDDMEEKIREEKNRMEEKIRLLLASVANPPPPLSSATAATVLAAVLARPRSGASAEMAAEAVAALNRFADAAMQRAAAPGSVALEAAEREAAMALTFAARCTECGGGATPASPRSSSSLPAPCGALPPTPALRSRRERSIRHAPRPSADGTGGVALVRHPG